MTVGQDPSGSVCVQILKVARWTKLWFPTKADVNSKIRGSWSCSSGIYAWYSRRALRPLLTGHGRSGPGRFRSSWQLPQWSQKFVWLSCPGGRRAPTILSPARKKLDRPRLSTPNCYQLACRRNLWCGWLCWQPRIQGPKLVFTASLPKQQIHLLWKGRL